MDQWDRLLRELIAQNPELSRRRLSVKVCEAWQWVQPNGQPRDMVCRSLMLALHRAGHIQLPPQRYIPPNSLANRLKPAPVVIDTMPWSLMVRPPAGIVTPLPLSARPPWAVDPPLTYVPPL